MTLTPDGRPITSWAEARDLAAGAAQRLDTELVDLSDADGRTVAEPGVARCDLPAFDTSAMDGWAVAGAGPWTIAGEVLAGQFRTEPMAAGTAVAIATGAAVPPGGEAIIRREAGSVRGDQLSGTFEAGADIRPCGEECAEGDELAPAGTVLGPATVGLLAAAGNDAVTCVRVPKVTVLLLGDELLTHGVPSPGKVRDSLGPQLPGWVSRLGGTVAGIERVADTTADLVTALAAASADADVVVTTGGTAAGPVDCLHGAIAEHDGELLVDSVAVRPGHPMVLARIAGTPLIGLPGNPQSAVVALLTLGQPLLAAMLGRAPEPLEPVVLTTYVAAPARETRLVLGTVIRGSFTCADHLGSAMLRGLASAGGFAVVPPGGGTPGDRVDWLPLP